MDQIIATAAWQCCGLTYTGSAAERAAVAYLGIALVAAAILIVVTRRG